jgi:proteasome lid subunit RPN8/RPN11
VTVVLPPAVRRAIVAHARRDRPNECCGLLIGRGGRIAFACPMANLDPAPAIRYRIDDADHIGLRRLLRRFAPRLDIVGVYHSHPAGGPRPSNRDLREGHYPDWIHLIVGFRGGRAVIYACRIRRGRARPLRTVPAAALPTPRGTRS